MKSPRHCGFLLNGFQTVATKFLEYPIFQTNRLGKVFGVGCTISTNHPAFIESTNIGVWKNALTKRFPGAVVNKSATEQRHEVFFPCYHTNGIWMRYSDLSFSRNRYGADATLRFVDLIWDDIWIVFLYFENQRLVAHSFQKDFHGVESEFIKKRAVLFSDFYNPFRVVEVRGGVRSKNLEVVVATSEVTNICRFDGKDWHGIHFRDHTNTILEIRVDGRSDR